MYSVYLQLTLANSEILSAILVYFHIDLAMICCIAASCYSWLDLVFAHTGAMQQLCVLE